MSASVLKPCPFCGGEAAIRYYRMEAQWVQCMECHARTDRYGPTEGALEAAITAWNTRVPSQQEAIAELVAGLAEIAAATSAEDDAGENYRWDDPEGALDFAYSNARALIAKHGGGQ